MKKDSFLKDSVEKIDKKKVFISIFVALVLFFTSYLMNEYNVKNIMLISITVSLLITFSNLVFINVIWELIAKKGFAKKVIELAGISNEIAKSGVVKVYDDFKDIYWKELLNNSKVVKAVFTYSTRWGKDNSEIFKKLSSIGCVMEVYLPNPLNEISILELNQRFFYDESQTQIDAKSEIINAIQYYLDLGFTVYLYERVFQNSYYLIDEVGFVSFFNHKGTKGMVTNKVPAIKSVKGGTFYTYISEEIEAIGRKSNKYEK